MNKISCRGYRFPVWQFLERRHFALSRNGKATRLPEGFGGPNLDRRSASDDHREVQLPNDRNPPFCDIPARNADPEATDSVEQSTARQCSKFLLGI
jgi:hypothetical protein